MLSQLCDDVYLSINANQVNSVEKGYRFITDMPEFQHAGPMTGLLSAFARCPVRIYYTWDAIILFLIFRN